MSTSWTGPLTYSNKVDSFLATKRKIEKDYQAQIIKKTIWGQRNAQSILNKMGFSNSESNLNSFEEYICEFLFLPKHMICNRRISFRRNDVITDTFNWILFPLVRCMDWDINVSFYHEMRHAIEHKNNYAEYFEMLNEFRTEQHAMKDERVLPSIFDNQKGFPSIYLKMLPFTYGLFEEYGHCFDEWIISKQMEEMEKVIPFALLK